ncbi:hypothetical protein HKD37_03G007072 [Glycine soja]
MVSRKRKATDSVSRPVMIDQDLYHRRLGTVTQIMFARLRPDPQELATWLCIPGRGFVLNVECLSWKLLRKDLTTLAQTWSVLSYSNLAPTSYTSDLNLDRARLVYGLVMKMNMNLGSLISGQISLIAQPNSSRLGFPALITALCKTRGATSDFLTYESISPGRTYKSKARGSEAPSSSAAPAPPTSALPSITAPTSAPAYYIYVAEPASRPASGYAEFAGYAQEPQPNQEDDSSEATLTPPEPFIFEDDLVADPVTAEDQTAKRGSSGLATEDKPEESSSTPTRNLALTCNLPLTCIDSES